MVSKLMLFKLPLVFNTFVHVLNMWCVFINKVLEGFDTGFLE